MHNSNCLRHVATIVILSTLVACATPQEAREKGPVESYSSTKTARVVTDCIAAELEALGHSSEMYVRPLSNGYSVQVARYGNTLLAVDILERGTGSTTNFYRGHAIGGNKRFTSRFHACQQ